MTDSKASEETSTGEQQGSAAAALGAVSGLINVAAGVLRGKVSAVWLGAAGLGTAAEVAQAATLAFTPVGLVFGPAFVRRLMLAESPDERRGLTTAALRSALVLGGLAVLATLALASIVGPPIERLLLFQLALLAAGTALVQAIQQGIQQVLVARSRLAQLTTLTAIATLSLSAGLALGTSLGGIRGQFLGALAGLLIGVAAWLRTNHSFVLEESTSQETARSTAPFLGEALRTGATTLASALALQMALVAIRKTLELEGGTSGVGQFQAAWSIGTTYFGVLLSGVTAYAFPRFAAASKEELLLELGQMISLVLKLAPPLVAIAIALKTLLVNALYSDSFQTTTAILGVQLAGDLAKGVSWMFGGALIYRGRLRAFLATELLAALLIGGLTSGAVHLYGVEAAGWGLILAFQLYLPITAYVVGLAEDVVVPNRWVYIPLLGSYGLLLVSQVADRWPWVNYFVLAAAASAMLFVPMPPRFAAMRQRALQTLGFGRHLNG